MLNLLTVAAAVFASALVLLILVGGVNCRAEEEYWREFWATTPSTEGSSDPESSSAEPGEEFEYRKAA